MVLLILGWIFLVAYLLVALIALHVAPKILKYEYWKHSDGGYWRGVKKNKAN